MKVIDLTHPIAPDMPVYPGTPAPKLTVAYTCEKDKFRETEIHLCSHVGTHMDAPAHVYSDGQTLDAFPADHFVGKALVIDCTDLAPGEQITHERLQQDPLVAEAEYLLIHTGWDRYWGTEAYFKDYPCVTAEAVDWIASCGFKGVGLDTISLDPVGKLARHWQLMKTGKTVILENLTGLSAVGKGLFTLCALPLHYQAADGAPARVVALLEDSPIF